MIFSNKHFEYAVINGQKIIVRGLGRMFYQEGMPIGILAVEAKKRGMKVSWIHIADELQKHGWGKQKIIAKLREEILDSGEVQTFDIKLLENFVYSSYEDQRDIIFNSLFYNNENAMEFLRSAF